MKLRALLAVPLFALAACGDETETIEVNGQQVVARTADHSPPGLYCEGTWFDFGSGHGGGGMICMCPNPGGGGRDGGPAWYQSNNGSCSGGGGGHSPR